MGPVLYVWGSGAEQHCVEGACLRCRRWRAAVQRKRGDAREARVCVARAWRGCARAAAEWRRVRGGGS